MLPLLCCLAAEPVLAAPPQAAPLYVYCGTGDHLWPWDREPVDSPATVDAMFDWMARTYAVRRMYWRGGQQEIWAEDYQVSPAEPQSYDWWQWCTSLFKQARINDVAVRAAHDRGMKIYMHTGLFEHGVQPDVGINCPYPFEDRLRIEHPQWCPRDRWDQRRAPGPLSFAISEVRSLLVERYVRHVTGHGYDGLSFYTYVENVGIRYDDEFGYEPAVIAEFQRLNPGVDPTRDTLTHEQRHDLHGARGRFVTDFLRELHTALQAKGKRLAVIVDSADPDNAQPWWGHPLPGTGSIRMDWQTWVREGIVDELYVQLGEVADQQKTLDRVLQVCAGTPVEVTVRATHPLQEPTWAKYVAQGVTPISCITSPTNDIERYTLEPTSAATLTDPDWRLRAQTLMNIAAGKLTAEAGNVAAATRDPHVLVRRQAVYAVAALQATGHIPDLEACLLDAESSVRIAAAAALGKLHGPDSPSHILDALTHDATFQFKEACVTSLGEMPDVALPGVAQGLRTGAAPVREVCARALYDLGKRGHQQEMGQLLRPVALDRGEHEVVRYWAVYGLLGSRLRLTPEQSRQIAADFLGLIPSETSVMVQLQLAYALGYMWEFTDAPMRRQVLQAMASLMLEYGDACKRYDAAFGWRRVGNALHQFGPEGDAVLEQLRSQRDDKWLAWICYEVLNAPQSGGEIVLTTEQEAVEAHAKHAPPFPGYRRW